MYFQVKKKKKTQNKSLIALWHCLYSCLLESAKSFTQTFICWDLSFVCSCFTHFHSSLCKISRELSVFIHCTESVSQGQKEKEEYSDGLIEMNKEKMNTEGKWNRIRPTRENCGKENAEEWPCEWTLYGKLPWLIEILIHSWLKENASSLWVYIKGHNKNNLVLKIWLS